MQHYHLNEAVTPRHLPASTCLKPDAPEYEFRPDLQGQRLPGSDQSPRDFPVAQTVSGVYGSGNVDHNSWQYDRSRRPERDLQTSYLFLYKPVQKYLVQGPEPLLGHLRGDANTQGWAVLTVRSKNESPVHLVPADALPPERRLPFW